MITGITSFQPKNYVQSQAAFSLGGVAINNSLGLLNNIISFLNVSDLSQLSLTSKSFNRLATNFHADDEKFKQAYRNTFNQKDVTPCVCEHNSIDSQSNHKPGCSTLFFANVIYTYGAKSRAKIIFAAVISSRHFPEMNMESIFGMDGIKLKLENIDLRYRLKGDCEWTKSYLLFFRVVLTSSRQNEISINMLIPALFMAFNALDKETMKTILTSSELNKKADELLQPDDNNIFVKFLMAMGTTGHLDVLEKVMTFDKLSEKLGVFITGIFKTQKLLETFQNDLNEITQSCRFPY